MSLTDTSAHRIVNIRLVLSGDFTHQGVTTTETRVVAEGHTDATKQHPTEMSAGNVADYLTSASPDRVTDLRNSSAASIELQYRSHPGATWQTVQTFRLTDFLASLANA